MDITPLSQELVLKCFPHKEAVLYNLDVAFDVLNKGGETTDEASRLSLLIECLQKIREGNTSLASQLAYRAGYYCMSQAITLHF